MVVIRGVIRAFKALVFGLEFYSEGLSDLGRLFQKQNIQVSSFDRSICNHCALDAGCNEGDEMS